MSANTMTDDRWTPPPPGVFPDDPEHRLPPQGRTSPAPGGDGAVPTEFHVTFDQGDDDQSGVMKIEAQYSYATPFEATQWLDACRQALVAELVKRGVLWQ